jgi:hypothetical protein
LGGLGRAVEIAREKAGVKPGEAHELVPYPSPSLISALNVTFARSGLRFGAQAGQLSERPSDLSWAYALGADLAGVPQRWVPALMRLLVRGGLMLLSPISK